MVKSIVDKDVELYFKNGECGNIYKVNTLYNINNVYDEFYSKEIYAQKGTRETTYASLMININNLMQQEDDIEKTIYSVSVGADRIICCRVESEESPKVFTDFFKYDEIREEVEIVKVYAKDISLENMFDLGIIIYYGKRGDYDISEFKQE